MRFSHNALLRWSDRGRALALSCVALALAKGTGLHAALLEKGELPSERFGRDDIGLMLDVVSMDFDRFGNLYAGHRKGISRFDGSQWLRLHDSNVPLRAIAVSTDGLLFFAKRSLFGYLRPGPDGSLQAVTLSDRVLVAEQAQVNAILVDDRHAFFVADDRIFKFERNTDQIATIESEGPFSTDPILSSDRVFVGVEGRGLMSVWADELLVEQEAREQLGAVDFVSLASDGEGQILGVLSNGTSFRYGEGKLTYVGRMPRGASSEVLRLRRVADNQYLSLKEDRVQILDSFLLPVGTVPLPSRDFLGAASNLALSRASPSVWMGGRYGVVRIDLAAPINRFDDQHGVFSDVEKAIRSFGTLYIESSRGLLVADALQSGTQQRFLPVVATQGLAVDLLGASSEGVLAVVEGELRVVRGQEIERPAQTVERIAGRPYEGPFQLARVVGDELQVFKRRNGAWTENPTTVKLAMAGGEVAEGPDGTFWIESGVGCLYRAIPLGNDYRIARYGSERGLPDAKIKPLWLNGELVFLALTRLLRFDTDLNVFLPYGRYDYIFQAVPEVRQLWQDPLRRIWIDDGTRLGYWNGSTVEADLETQPLEAWGPIKGEIVLAEESGLVWFGTDRGLLEVDTAQLKGDDDPIELVVSRAEAFGSDRRIYDQFARFSESPESIELHLAAFPIRLSVAAANAARLKDVETRLRSDDEEDWSDWKRGTALEVLLPSVNRSELQVEVRRRGRSISAAKFSIPLTQGKAAGEQRKLGRAIAAVVLVAVIAVILAIVVAKRRRAPATRLGGGDGSTRREEF